MNLPKKNLVLTLILIVCLAVFITGIAFAGAQPLSFTGTVKYIAL